MLRIILLTILLTGCATKFEKGSAGMVYWHKLDSQDEIVEACLPPHTRGSIVFNIRGCYVFNDNVCHIYAQDDINSMKYLGHELKHCFDGHFHNARGQWYKLDKNGNIID
jgi:hypothetical protein